MRQWRTTGNSNVAIQTGSTYISDSMTDITTIPKANLGFSTRASWQKVSTRQHRATTGNSDMATKTGNSYTTETTTDSVDIPTANPGFSTTASRIMCRQVIETMADNRKWQCVPQKRKYISGTMTDIWQLFQQQIWGFLSTSCTKKLTLGDCDNDRQPEMAI